MRGEGGDTAAATAGKGGVDDQNSISSYADDFVDDDGVVPPGQRIASDSSPQSSDKPAETAESPNAVTKGSVNSNPAGQQEGEGRSIDNSASATGTSSSPTLSGESESRAGVPTTGGTDRKTSRSSVAYEDRDRRRPSTLDKSKDTNDIDAAVGITKKDGSSGAARSDNGRKGGATTPLDSSPSVKELEDRLREADLENDRLRKAIRTSEAASTGNSDSQRKELELLKSQVEAAR